METWLQFLLGFVLLIGIGVGVAIIGIVLRLRRTLQIVENGIGEFIRLLAELRRSLLPAIEAWGAAAQRLDRTLRETEPGLASMQRFASLLRTMAEHLHSVEERVYRRIMPPLEEVTTLLTGALKGLAVFVRFLTNRAQPSGQN
ncbi:MAG: hypothetical protein NZ473_06485 [Candidatus Kapabacteria bacterium]|nr:hypothetical protein [Candidatus Kapabacteria bacterium]MDW8225637.1 hypothetical protein [Bacteroidota bacterium]